MSDHLSEEVSRGFLRSNILLLTSSVVLDTTKTRRKTHTTHIKPTADEKVKRLDVEIFRGMLSCYLLFPCHPYFLLGRCHPSLAVSILLFPHSYHGVKSRSIHALSRMQSFWHGWLKDWHILYHTLWWGFPLFPSWCWAGSWYKSGVLKRLFAYLSFYAHIWLGT